MPGESQQTPKTEPDPSVLTTQQLDRGLESARDYVDGKVEVILEQFTSVGTQFTLIERQRVEQKKDTKDAVDAALAAAKEAVQEQTKASAEAIGKSEALTETRLVQLGTQFQTGISGVADKIDDLKDRLVRLETVKVTENNNHAQQRLDYGLLVSIAGVCISIIAVVVVVLLANVR